MADYAKDLASKFGVGQQMTDTQRLYQFLLQSPQFQQENNLAGAQASNDISAGLSQRGLSTSGIGTVAGALGKSASSFGASALKGGLFGTAGSMASQNLLARLQAYSSYKNAKASQPSFLEGLAGGVLSAGGAVLAGPAGAAIFGGGAKPMPGPMQPGQERPMYSGG
jgi:hypothetical protein